MMKNKPTKAPLEPWLSSIQQRCSAHLGEELQQPLSDELQQVWVSIEQKLDGKGKATPRIVYFRRMVMVAASVLTVAGLLISIYTLAHKQQPMPTIAKVVIQNASETAIPFQPKHPTAILSSPNGSEFNRMKSAHDAEVSNTPQSKSTTVSTYNGSQSTLLQTIAPRDIVLPSRETNIELYASEINYAMATSEFVQHESTVAPNHNEVTVELPDDYNKLLSKPNDSRLAQEINNDTRGLETLALSTASTVPLARYNTQPLQQSGFILKSRNILPPFVRIPSDEDEQLKYNSTTFRHALPLRAGARVSLPITKYISIESGIRYTMLVSKASNYLPGESLQQRIHYVGIPLGFDVELFRYKRFNLYAGADFAVDKAVYSSLNQKSLDILPWQLSVNVHSGFAFDIIPQLALYASPSLSYYFDDGTKLKTYYKSHPLNFSISFGLRFMPLAK